MTRYIYKVRRSFKQTGFQQLHCRDTTKNLNFNFGLGWLFSGYSIGSLGNYVNEEGVENVTVTSSTFTKTENGVRIKTRPQPSSGYIRDIVFRNLIMHNVNNPIIIDQRYCAEASSSCPRHQVTTTLYCP